MCGLVAWVSPGPDVDPARLGRATDALARRGPDGRGVWVSADRRAGLGHRRLAVMDLVGGAQPLLSADGQLAAVVNGELYDEGPLRRSLEAKGHVFRTQSDSELILHLYAEHGAELVHQLRGEFAFALWDARRGRLLAARDRFGVRPLVYAKIGGAWWLASEVKALLAAGLPARWSEAALAQSLSLQYLLPHQSLFAGVRSLGPGERLLIEASAIRVERWWRPELRPARDPPGPEAVREALSQAVSVRLRSDAPLACQLSGGLDSAAVAALAVEAGARPPAFTVAFDTPPWDERAQAAETAAALGLPHHVLELEEADLAEGLEDTVVQGEGLLINGHAVAKRLLAQVLRQLGFRAVLTGEGADEVALGYAFFHDGRRGASVVSDGVHRPLTGAVPEGMGALAEAFGELPTFLLAKAGLGARVGSVLRPEHRAALAAHQPAAAILEGLDLPALRAMGPARRSQQLWLRLGLPAYVLRLVGDGAVTPEGVEDRPPFLDRRVWEAFAAHPEEALLAGDVEKALLREALRGVLPEAVRLRPKQPFMAPAPRPGGPLMRTLRARFGEAPLPECFDRGALLGLVDRWASLSPGERVAWESTLWMAASASILQERYGMGALR